MTLKNDLIKNLSFTVSLLSLLFLAQLSWTHTELVRVSPANNAMLMSLPEAIELEFSHDVTLTKLNLSDRMNKSPVELGFEPSTQAESSYRLALPVLEVGTYLIEWTILGPDGHEVSGSAGFMLHSDGVNVMDMSQPMPGPDSQMPLDSHHGHH